MGDVISHKPGWAEIRAIENFEKNAYPEIKKKIDSVTEFDVSIEVSWDSIAENGFADIYEEAFPKVYFIPLLNAFIAICAKDIGKTALKGTLKKVVVHNLTDSSSPSSFSFNDGTLIIDHSPVANMDDIKDRTDRIVSLLEDGLSSGIAII